jgi:hypothetical protein
MRASTVGLALAFALFGLPVATASAEPFAYTDACFVRAEPRPPGSASNVVPAASESRLGIRRKTGQLFDVELSVVGPDGALCSVSGVARLRPGEALVLPVRPEGGKTAKPAATPCLVSFARGRIRSRSRPPRPRARPSPCAPGRCSSTGNGSMSPRA